MSIFVNGNSISTLLDNIYSDLLPLRKIYDSNRALIGDLTKLTEEDFKNGFINPFLKFLEFDVSNFAHVRTEVSAGVRSNSYTPCDYVLFHSDDSSNGPSVVIESKKYGFNMKQGNIIDAFSVKLPDVEQLKEYFIGLRGQYSKKALKFGVLTDGLTYYFYKDGVSVNIMDVKPFYQFDIEDILIRKSKLDLLVLHLLKRRWNSTQLDNFIIAAEKVTDFKKWVSTSRRDMPYLNEEAFEGAELRLLTELFDYIPVDTTASNISDITNSVKFDSDFISVTDIDVSTLVGTRPSCIKVGSYVEEVSKWTKCLDIILRRATLEKSAEDLVDGTAKNLKLGGLTQKFLFSNPKDLTCDENAINGINGTYYRSHLGAKDVVVRAIILQSVTGDEVSIKYSNINGEELSNNLAICNSDKSSYVSVMNLTSDDVVGKRPECLKILGSTIEVNSWRNVYLNVIEKIVDVIGAEQTVMKARSYIKSTDGVSKDFLFLSKPNINCREGYISEIKGVYVYNNLSVDAVLPRICVLRRVLGSEIEVKILN